MNNKEEIILLKLSLDFFIAFLIQIYALFIKLTFLNNYFGGFYLSKSEDSFLMFILKIIIIIFQNGWENRCSRCPPMQPMRGKYGGHALCGMSTKTMQILRRRSLR